jgi:hypothetical protein
MGNGTSNADHVEVPTWDLVVAILLTLYNAFRGGMGNWIAMVRKNEGVQTPRKSKTRAIVILYSLHDALFHLIYSLAGLVSLLVAQELYDSSASAESFDAGKSVLLAFACLFGIVRITGSARRSAAPANGGIG